MILILTYVNLLIIGIADRGLARVGQRIGVQTIRQVSYVCEKVQHVLVQVEPERGLIQLDLIQNVFMLEVQLRFRLLYHHIIR